MIEVRVSIYDVEDDNYVELIVKDGERTSYKWGNIKIDKDILNEALDLVLKAYKGGEK